MIDLSQVLPGIFFGNLYISMTKDDFCLMFVGSRLSFKIAIIVENASYDLFIHPLGWNIQQG